MSSPLVILGTVVVLQPPIHYERDILTLIRPDFTNTEPAVNIGPFPQWSDPKKIVAMDPLGHLAPWLFKETIEQENGT